MNKKNIATTIILLLCSCLFAVTGSTFMNLLYKKNKIIVNNPKVVASSQVFVYEGEDDDKNQIEEITFNDINLGLKPVTGQADKDTNIPTTVTNKHGSEGLYSAIKVTAPAETKIQITNIKIDSSQDMDRVKAERKNMWIALKDIKNSAQTLESDLVLLMQLNEAIEDKEFIVFFWLDGNADEVLKGAKISFEMHFIT